MSSSSRVLKLFADIWNIGSKGVRNERRVVAAFSEPFWDIPGWFQSVQNASPVQEPKGIDIVVQTDIGRIFIQVKSCAKKAEAFRANQKKGRYREDIAVIVIEEHFSPEQVRRVTIRAAYGEYQKKLFELSTEHGANFIPAELSAA